MTLDFALISEHERPSWQAPLSEGLPKAGHYGSSGTRWDARREWI
ncbi:MULTISPECIES: hypothetical protein [unclassified Mameliella]|nr:MULTISPECIES: hypothetical protein [unclassified Mameliella]